MSYVEGKLVTCDVCGESVFLKYIGDGEVDGGFTKWRKYEEMPKGWETARVGKVTYSTLCPACFERIQDDLLRCIDSLRGIDGIRGMK